MNATEISYLCGEIAGYVSNLSKEGKVEEIEDIQSSVRALGLAIASDLTVAQGKKDNE